MLAKGAAMTCLLLMLAGCWEPEDPMERLNTAQRWVLHQHWLELQGVEREVVAELWPSPDYPLPHPLDLEVTTTDCTTAHVRWTDPGVSRETNWRAYGRRPGAFWGRLGEHDNSRVGFDATGLPAEHDYEFAVETYDPITGQRSLWAAFMRPAPCRFQTEEP